MYIQSIGTAGGEMCRKCFSAKLICTLKNNAAKAAEVLDLLHHVTAMTQY